MRLPVSGGPPRLVYENPEAQLQDYPCARAPASSCIVIEATQDNRRLTITALVPLKGKGEVLRTVEKDPRAG